MTPPCELCNDTGYVKSNTLELEGPCPNGCDAHYIAGYRQAIEDAAKEAGKSEAMFFDKEDVKQIELITHVRRTLRDKIVSRIRALLPRHTDK